MKYNLLFFFALTISIVQAQKMELIDNQEEITAKAILELDTAMMVPEGKIYAFSQKYNLNGNITLDLTIREKGEVASVFVVKNENGSINSQNILKDFLQNFQFSFKMPKGKRYKFQYEFKFD